MAEFKNKAINIEDIKSSYIKKKIFTLLNQDKLEKEKCLKLKK